MDVQQNFPRSHLFTVRLWQEDVGGGKTEIRGEVRHIPSGETAYFRDWLVLVKILQEMYAKWEPKK